MPSGMGGVSVFQEVFGLTRLGETLRAYQARDPAARSRLEEQMARAAEERGRLGRMWSVLGVSAGVLAVVMLY